MSHKKPRSVEEQIGILKQRDKEKIVTLIKNNPQISIYKIGFPMDWFDEDIWK